MPILKDYKLVVDYQDVPEIAQILDRHPVFGLDLETTGLDHKRDEIHGVALATDTQEWYVTLGAEQAFYPLLADLVKRRTIAGHNILFDLHFLGAKGIRVPKVVDTMVGQFLVDENQSLGLKPLAMSKLGITEQLPDFADMMDWAMRLVGKKKKSDVNIYDMPLERVSEYAARDARLTMDLLRRTEHELEKEGMLKHFYEVEMPYVLVLQDMEEAGFYIDQDKLAELDVLFQERLAEQMELFTRLAPGVNPNSDLQLGKLLYETLGYKATRFTEGGAPSTDALALARLLSQDSTGVVRAVLRQRKYEKVLSTYVRKYRNTLYEGRLHSNFNRTGTVTGRLSSSGHSGNLQNIPSQGEIGHLIKELFGAPAGYTFVDIDYSQLELRILAHYSRDESLVRVFEEHLDPHRMTVDRLADLGYKISRSHAKRVNFGWAYGIGPRGLADQIEDGQVDEVIEDDTKVLERPSEADTKIWLNGFEQAYPGAARWKQNVFSYGAQLGYVRTIAGRRRHLPDLASRDRSLQGRAQRQGPNAIIQGTASDLMQWAMLQIHPLLPQYGAKMTAQVHDELTFEVPDEAREEFGHKAAALMRQAGEFFGMRIKLEAEPGYGPNWATAKG